VRQHLPTTKFGGVWELLLDGARMRLELEDPRALLPVGHEPARQTDMTRLTEQVAELAQRLARLEARAAQASAEVLTGQQSPPLTDEPDFDTARFMLGPLCHQRHDWHGTGQSVRQRGGKHECRECKRARKARYKQRQKSAGVIQGFENYLCKISVRMLIPPAP